MDRAAKLAKQKKTSSYWKFIVVTHSWKSGRSPRSSVIIILIIKIFQNSWSCPQTYRGAGRRQKSLLDGTSDFLATIWQPITTVSFVWVLIFFPRKPKNASKRVLIGPKHNLVNFKSLWGVFL